MSYWIKHFADAKNETGTDDDVRRGEASWSKGRLKGITSATLSYAGTVVVVPGLEIWHKDKYGAAFNLPPSRISRSLGTKITRHEVGKKLYLHDSSNIEVYCLSMTDIAPKDSITIQQEHVGKWAVATIKRNGNPVLTIEEKYRV